MRLFIDYKLNDSGKGKFLGRLIPALKKIGVKCQFTEKGADVALGVSVWKTKTKLPKVLRVDGIYLEGGKKAAYWNTKIKKAIKKADHVIYQSQFAKRKIEKRLKVKKSCSVIYNGANPEDYKIKNGMLPHHLTNVVMVARWGNRKHKRLDLHLQYAKDNPHVHCWLIGDCKVRETDNLKVLGHLKDEQLREYLIAADGMVYLADLDWCPNAVVEAKVAGLPITYNPKCKAVKELYDLPVEELYIQNVAKQYKEVLRGCINKLS